MWKNPKPTVDTIIEIDDKIVLIKRKNPPYGWAIPGGFVDYGETLEAAAIRESFEETGLTVKLRELLYVYSDPKRDSRQHNISAVFTATASGSPIAGDDAAEAQLFSMSTLPDLAFDHAKILADYSKFKSTGERPTP
jgi:8-oxo-dGTP diphosphatase